MECSYGRYPGTFRFVEKIICLKHRLMKKKLFSLLVLVFAIGINMTRAQKSPYITKVFEFRPAPGQFVNELPKYSTGDTPETMAKKAENAIANNNGSMVSLGGYGGYIVVGFDHPIINVTGTADFKVMGNAFWAASNPNPSASKRGGSCEPGIVMVSADVNKNGLPDDPWYELAGSEYNKPETIKKYEITYYKPDENKAPTPDMNYQFLTDTTYIKWTTNGYGNSYVFKNSFHKQSYYPQWLTETEMKFSGTKLANNYVDESGNGSYYVQYSYPWGYADNAPNTDPMSDMNIDWAVDKDGNPVHLPAIDFVKIYTGVNQYCGWLGETSTEVMGITDLHPNAVLTGVRDLMQSKTVAFVSQGKLIVRSSEEIEEIAIFNMQGTLIKTVLNMQFVELSEIPKGIYIIKTKTANGIYAQKITNN